MQNTVPQIEVELQMHRLLCDGYRPHLQVNAGEYLGVSFFDVPLQGEAGQPLRAKERLVYWPEVDYSPLKTGSHFQVKEGARTVGFGTVIVGEEHHVA